MSAQMMRAAHPAGAAAALRGRAERPDYESALASLDVPALVVVGDEDAFTTRTDAEQMHVLLRRSEVVWKAGAGDQPHHRPEGHLYFGTGPLPGSSGPAQRT